jgi:hypothetical protein
MTVETPGFAQANTLAVATGSSLLRNLPVTVLLPGLHCPADGGMLFQKP